MSITKKELCHRTVNLFSSCSVKRHLNDRANAITTIGEKGQLIYAVYTGENISGCAAELFENQSGQLVSVLTIPVPQGHIVINDGRLNSDATKFTFIYTNLETEILTIQEYNILGHLLISQTFSDVHLQCLPLIGGNYSPDGLYLVIHYLFKHSKENQNSTIGEICSQPSVLKILESQTLKTIAEYHFQGVANDLPWFNLSDDKARKKSYLVLSSSLLSNVGSSKSYENPHRLQILEFSPSLQELRTLDELFLPNFALATTAWPNICEVSKLASKTKGPALIAVNTKKAITQQQALINSDLKANSGLLNDGAELRLYRFDGKYLSLISTIDHNEDGGSLCFSPDAQFLAAIIRHYRQNILNSIEINSSLQVFKLPCDLNRYCEKCLCESDRRKREKRKCHCGLSSNRLIPGHTLDHMVENTSTPKASFSINWSCDQKWIIVSGIADQVTSNLQLFKVDINCLNICSQSSARLIQCEKSTNSTEMINN
jgi:hypothetical protein